MAAGAVMVGGAGTRMGGDKARVTLGDRPLGAWVAGAMARAGLAPVLAIGSPPGWAPPATIAHRDLRPGAGPLWALRSALAASPAEVTVVSACDLPCVRPSTLRRLAAAVDGDHPLAVATVGGRPLPVLVAASRRLLAIVDLLAGAGAARASAPLGPVGWRPVPVAPDEVRPVNRPDDLARLPSLDGNAWRW